MLRVTGGTTASDVWMQILANVTGMKVEIPNVQETGALGAAAIAMVGAEIMPMSFLRQPF